MHGHSDLETVLQSLDVISRRCHAYWSLTPLFNNLTHNWCVFCPHVLDFLNDPARMDVRNVEMSDSVEFHVYCLFLFREINQFLFFLPIDQLRASQS